MRATTRERLEGARRLFEALALTYQREVLESDPLAVVHRFEAAQDQELVAYLAAGLAFGRAGSVKKAALELVEPLGAQPSAFLDRATPTQLKRCLRGFRYRWIDEGSVVAVLSTLQSWRRESGSLSAFFQALDAGDAHGLAMLGRASQRARQAGPTTRGYRFFFASPEDGSPCKRLFLFLRWMSRPRDGLDLNLWPWFSPERLVIPLDTHLGFLGRALGMTKRRTPDLGMALEITSFLRLLDQEDPLRYDWPLSRLGILGLCSHRADPKLCTPCTLRPLCRVGRKFVGEHP